MTQRNHNEVEATIEEMRKNLKAGGFPEAEIEAILNGVRANFSCGDASDEDGQTPDEAQEDQSQEEAEDSAEKGTGWKKAAKVTGITAGVTALAAGVGYGAWCLLSGRGGEVASEVVEDAVESAAEAVAEFFSK